MIPYRIITRSLSKQLRYASRSAALSQAEAQAQPAAASPPPEKLIIPPPPNVDKPVSAKIEKLVTEISQLNLVEVSELSGLLKRRLNLPDASMMPMGGFAAVAAPSAEEEEEAEPEVKKTIFTVKLVKYEGVEKEKVELIKVIRELFPGTNLLQARKFINEAPNVVKADVSKDEADTLKEKLEKVGGVVEIE